MTKHPSQRPPYPRCGADQVVPIVYGLPAPELFERADRGEVELGGCCPDAPNWACRKCGHRWEADE